MKKDKCEQMNPNKYLMIDDMANLTYLNEASILANLRDRYKNTYIYVSTKKFKVGSLVGSNRFSHQGMVQCHKTTEGPTDKDRNEDRWEDI